MSATASLTKLPSPGDQFLLGAAAYTCVGRFLTKPGAVIAVDGSGHRYTLDLSARLMPAPPRLSVGDELDRQRYEELARSFDRRLDR